MKTEKGEAVEGDGSSSEPILYYLCCVLVKTVTDGVA